MMVRSLHARRVARAIGLALEWDLFPLGVRGERAGRGCALREGEAQNARTSPLFTDRENDFESLLAHAPERAVRVDQVEEVEGAVHGLPLIQKVFHGGHAQVCDEGEQGHVQEPAGPLEQR